MNKAIRTIQCAGCGDTITGSFGARKRFCTDECKKIYGVKGEPQMRAFKCLGCGKESFGHIRKEKKFCDIECRGKFGYKPNPKQGTPEPCAVCGASVDVTPRRRESSKTGLFFCCPGHANEWQGKDKLRGECEVCGKDFVRSQSYIKRGSNKFCSNECRYKSQDFLSQSAQMNKVQQDKTVNNLERLGYKTLSELGIEFIPQHVIGSKFCVDAFLPGLNIVVQFDGDYWHGNPEGFPVLSDRQAKRVKLDQSQDRYFLACGFSVLRIWESEFKKDIEAVKKKMSDAIKDRQCDRTSLYDLI